MIKPSNSYNRKNSDITGRPLPGKVVKLLLEARWAILAVFAIYLAISLLSYTKIDPAWSHATADLRVGNLGGRIGAWVADLLLFMFGSSAALIFIPLLSSMYAGYRRIAGRLAMVTVDGLHPYEWMFRWFGFVVMLLGSVGLEHLIAGERERFLPRAPGGVIGEVLAGASVGPLGYAGSVMTFLLMIGLGASLFFGVSWLVIAERLGAFIEGCFIACLGALSSVRDRRIGQIAAVRRDEVVMQERMRSSDDGILNASAQNRVPRRIEPVLQSDISTDSDSGLRHVVKVDVDLLDQSPALPSLSDEVLDRPPINIASAPPQEIKNNVDHEEIIASIPDSFRSVDVVPIAPLRLVSTVSKEEVSNIVDISSRKVDAVTPPIHIVAQVVAIAKSERAVRESQGGLFPQILSSALPSIGLLDEVTQVSEPVSDDVLAATSRLIERKLKDFGIEVKVVSAFPGPVITRYEIEPSVGVKGSAIVNLARDLARALSLSSLRVVEVIPGKTYMGLELPNAKREIVRLTEIIGSKVYSEGASNLTIALGKDISGDAVVADLAKMPHLLIAGTTGSGKSVGINATILSLLYKADPNDVRMILIDPKMLELSVYEGIPHLLAPVVTDMRQAGHALNWAVGEMERRYKIMSKVGVRNLQGYNDKIAQHKITGDSIPNPFSLTPDDPEPLDRLPNIVIFIDELADLMMVVGKKVEELIARIAQKARAAGIHLILATQRPSVDVITGLIKANIPTRIAFQVSSKIDSRTILDQMGAEALLGMGDMLYMPPGTAHPVRVHGAFVSDDEVHRVVNFLRAQGQPNYIEGILEGGVISDGSEAGPSTQSSSGESDEMYEQAVDVVLKNRRASISLVQRHLRIGYNRAARLLEQMENNGVVSSMQTNGNRDILVPASASNSE